MARKVVNDETRRKDREQARRWRAANWEHIQQYSREFHWKQMGVTPTRPYPQFCECCGGPQLKRAFSLDHCHVTKKFRGWLCCKCNTAIGKLGDTLEGVMNAVRYLQRNQ